MIIMSVGVAVVLTATAVAVRVCAGLDGPQGPPGPAVHRGTPCDAAVGAGGRQHRRSA